MELAEYSILSEYHRELFEQYGLLYVELGYGSGLEDTEYLKQRLRGFLKENLPDIKIVHAEATYLVWLNLSTLQGSGKEIGGFLREKTGLYLTDGGLYGRGGENFLRMNLACPRSVVEDGLRRMREGIAAYKKL